MGKEIKKTEDIQRTGSKWGNYTFVSLENKVKIAKYASEHSVTASMRHFRWTGEFSELKESTVRGWVTAYQSKLEMESTEITKFSEKQWGRPLLIGKELESKVKEISQEL